MIINITPEEFMALTPTKRLMAVKEHIELNPQNHNQSFWMVCNTACGTVACIAGWTVILAGNDFDMEGQTYSQIAKNLLGLTHHQGAKLFYSSNDEVMHLLDEIIAENSE